MQAVCNKKKYYILLRMEKFVKILANKGFKLTSQRKEVLNVLLAGNKPMSLKQIHDKAVKIDFASVYRIIRLFKDIGIVEEVNLGDKALKYEIQNSGHHHHIVCEKCHKIQRIDLCLLDKISKMTDYKIVSHIIEFRGICPECSKLN